MSSIYSEYAGIVVAIVFAAIAFSAVAFVAWPAWRGAGSVRGQAILAGALGAFVIGIGGGAYLLVGSPEIAREAVAGPSSDGIKGLVVALARRMRERPRDVTGWTLLGRGYLTLDDPEQAAIAFHHASVLAPPQQKPGLLSAYGEALTLAAGAVTPDAEDAFRDALAANPGDFAARYYLGQAYAERHDTPRALELWRMLLADSPPNAPWRANVTSRMAALQAQAGAKPDVRAMVEGLAARLRIRPEDPSGWQKLVRSYVVLGETEKARAALSDARTALRGSPEALAAIDAEAQSLNLVR